MMKKSELKTIAQRALESEYGFAPCKNKITLLEVGESNRGLYILVEIGVNEYRIDTFLKGINGYYVGKGIVEKQK